MITKEQLQVCQTALLERQHELIYKLHKNNHFDLAMSAKDSVGELSGYDNHPGDMGTELYERGKDIALNEHTESELTKINSALHAIEEGTYGICSVCGVNIPFERLLAIPMTEHCTQHAKQGNHMHERPSEEDILIPNLNREVEREVQAVDYDAEDAWQEVSKYGSSDTPSDLYGNQDNYNKMYANADKLVGATEPIENLPDPN